ncbi:MAG: methyltransferase domain-containing protein [Candidatus Micrarchaeota archaeon]|nr:methyltransferase domain-containing protein [Candidatus Micrarchaeota archaeon]
MLIFVLGRQPALGLAELEALFGGDAVRQISYGCAMVDAKYGEELGRTLGGSMKIAEMVIKIPSSRMNKIYSASRNAIVKQIVNNRAQTRIGLGLSAYGMQVSEGQMHRLSFDIKRKSENEGKRIRITIGKGLDLNSAQVIHNKLIGDFGFEFILVGNKKETYLARTVYVQDIESYSKRDYERPGRDTKIGMLPPKLAQMMLNLAGVREGMTVLDPFCGTGVVLMEAALKCAKVMGSDKNAKMVEYTKSNLKWLGTEYKLGIDIQWLGCADATVQKWKNHFDSVVTEVYLGPHMTRPPNERELDRVVKECDMLVRKFLVNLRPQLSEGSRCCIAIPAWRMRQGFVHLPIIGQLESLGYLRVSFAHADSKRMIYHRQDQMVARELLVLKKGAGQ